MTLKKITLASAHIYGLGLGPRQANNGQVNSLSLFSLSHQLSSDNNESKTKGDISNGVCMAQISRFHRSQFVVQSTYAVESSSIPRFKRNSLAIVVCLDGTTRRLNIYIYIFEDEKKNPSISNKTESKYTHIFSSIFWSKGKKKTVFNEYVRCLWRNPLIFIFQTLFKLAKPDAFRSEFYI